MGKLGTVVAVFAVLLVYFAESKTDGYAIYNVFESFFLIKKSYFVSTEI